MSALSNGQGSAAGTPGQPLDSAAAPRRSSDGTRQAGPAAGVSDPDLALHRDEIEVSARDKPHVTPNEAGAPVQDDSESTNDVPVMPANASGVDAVGTDEQDEAIDDESMYDRRPARDKNHPPSEG